MKKNLYILMVLMSVVFGFTACSDDDEPIGTQNPETEVAGTYSGAWTRVLTNSSGEVQSTETANGTITIAANRQWVVDVTLNEAQPVIASVMTDIANCSGTSENGYQISNAKGATLGNFSGVVEDGVMSFGFQREEKDGRKTYTATYTFEGVLNN